MRRRQHYTLRGTLARGLLGGLGVWAMLAAWVIYNP